MKLMKAGFSICVVLAAVGFVPAAGHAGQNNMSAPRAGPALMPQSNPGSLQLFDKSTPQEGLSLNFSHVQMNYKPQGDDGAKSPPPPPPPHH